MTAHPQTRIGPVHLKVTDLDAALAFYRDVIGLTVTQRHGDQAAFLSAGGYHHHLGLNTWHSKDGPRPDPRAPGLCHTALLHPDRQALAAALQRALDHGVPVDGAADHGVSEAIHFPDPDGNGIEIYRDRDPADWPRRPDGTLNMGNAALDLDALLAERDQAVFPLRPCRGLCSGPLPVPPLACARIREGDMATGKNIRTWFDGSWHDGDAMIIRAADHGAWLGSGVFDGARMVDGLTPDLAAHCARVNRSAEALMLRPTVPTAEMVARVREGLAAYAPGSAVYIRPMYWGIHGDATAIVPQPDQTGFAICLEEIPMAPESASVTLGRTRFRRPVMEDAVVDAKAGCLYPNNARMLAEVRARGFGNALVADAMGNVAESATANVFMVRDGVVFTPIANGTFLAGITRARHISNMRADGMEVRECVLTFEDFQDADEVFLSGNMNKVTPVTGFEDISYPCGPVTRRVRELYWDWATASRAEP